MADVTDLLDFRRRKQHQKDMEAFERGEAFRFRKFDYNPDLSLGFVEHETHKVVLLTNPEELEGIVMTVDSAQALRDELTEMLKPLDQETEQGGIPDGD